MTAPLIDSDVLFQTLLTELNLPGATVRATVEEDTFDRVPWIAHYSTIQQTANGDGAWSCVLNVNAYIESTAENHALIKALYAGIHSWGDDPFAGVVDGVGAIEVVEDIEALARSGPGLSLLNKVITPYQGSFNLLIRNH